MGPKIKKYDPYRAISKFEEFRRFSEHAQHSYTIKKKVGFSFSKII